MQASAAAAKAEEAWIEPALHNQNIVRGAAIVAAVAAAAKATAFLPSTVATYVHLMAFAMWVGTNAYTTFVAGITLFKNLPRQTFGRVQSKLFPVYFAINSACIVLCLGTALLRGDMASSVTTLGAALACTLGNQFALEPMTTDNMFKRYAMESDGQQETPGYQALKKKFGPLHGISSLLNLVALMCAAAHGYTLAGMFPVA